LTIGDALLQGTQLLDDGGVAVPRLTAEVLLAHALRRDRTFLYSHATEPLTEIGWIHFGRYLHERLKGKPTQYITRKQEFYGRDFRVSPAVLIPRPETEHVVEAALKRIAPGAEVADIGTGSGAIAVTLALESSASVFATDISVAALGEARENARELGAVVHFLCCDLMGSIRERSLDAVISNPPYVPRGDQHSLQREVRDYEPHVALFAGATGLELYARIIADATRVLRPGGALVLELSYTAAEPVSAMLDARWKDIELIPDLAGIPRVLAATLGP